jgi:hypothetical protein
VTVVATPSPTIIITPTVPSPPTRPVTVTFQIQVTVPTGVGIQDAVIDFGDGVTNDLGGLTGSVTVQHTYQTTTPPGQIAVTVRVLDTTGRTTQGTTSITIS